MSDLKVCPRCERQLQRSEFGTRMAASGNTVSRSACRNCAREIANAAYDSASARAKYSRLSAADRERLRRYNYERQRHLRGSTVRAERVRRWREANADRVAEYARSYKVENRAMVAARERAREARKRQLTVVPFTKNQLVARLSMFHGCWICGGPKETIDHVKPLSAGGAHTLSNLRPACLSCNSRKRSRWPFSVEMLDGAAAGF